MASPTRRIFLEQLVDCCATLECSYDVGMLAITTWPDKVVLVPGIGQLVGAPGTRLTRDLSGNKFRITNDKTGERSHYPRFTSLTETIFQKYRSIYNK
jgi:hypothetical protein